MSTTAHLRFVFVGLERDWSTFEGDTPPSKGRVYVYRSVPGNVVAWGHSPEQAEERLRKAVMLAASTRETPEEWYQSELLKMSPEDTEEQMKFLRAMWNKVGAKLHEMSMNTWKAQVLVVPPRYVSKPDFRALSC